METRHKLILENKIESAIEEISGDKNFQVFFCQGLEQRMAKAAEAVFDISMEAQIFFRDNGEV
jgi:hypothetical protein